MSALKPEHVLKRANDLINSAVGTNGEKEKRMARDQLHAVICVKKKNVWTKAFEPLMRRHLELCVELKDYATAKDGLHQYRNISFATDPSSLENVIVYLLDLAEDGALRAQQKAERVALAAEAKLTDLEQQESPESIMLSSMTEEGAKERTYRELVVPWLRFLWESYRSVLELLYKLPKLEKVYHDSCKRAFNFCLKYKRAMEFRRLCEMLRLQLVNLQKAPLALPATGLHAVLAAKKQSQFEWTSDAIEAHLQTRFTQLEVACSLRLYNEAFRTVEDINLLFLAHKKTPLRSKLLVSYYERLASLFLVAENKLLHAYALLQLFVCTVDVRGKDLKAAERERLANHALVAALAVPAGKDISSAVSGIVGVTVEEEESSSMDRASSIARLMDFSSNPSRANLLQEIAARGVVSASAPALRVLYEQMEKDFAPLSLAERVAPALESVRGDAALSGYLSQLERTVVVKVVQQLARVYTTLRLDSLLSLLAPLPTKLTAVQVERILLDAIAHKQLSLRISHAARTLSFTAAQSSVATMETQTAQLGEVLGKIARALPASVSAQEAKETARKAFLQRVLSAQETAFEAQEARKLLIERRKEELEKAQEDQLLLVEQRLQLEKEKREREEKERLAREEKARKDEQIRKEMEKVEIAKLESELQRIDKLLVNNKQKVSKTNAELTAFSASQRNALLVEAQELLAKQKEDENKRQAQELKTRDHVVRAVRMEEVQKLNDRRAALCARDQAYLVEKIAARKEVFATQHALDLEEKKRLQKMQGVRENFESALLDRQRIAFQVTLANARAKLIRDERERRLARARAALDAILLEQEKEREAERMREEQARLEIERAEALRLARERELEAERQRELEKERKAKHEAEEKERMEKMLKQIEEAEKAAAAAKAEKEKADREKAAAAAPAVSVVPRGTPLPPAAAASTGAYQPPSRAYQPPRPGPAADTRREPADDGEGGWRRAGPPQRERERPSGGFGDRRDAGRDTSFGDRRGDDRRGGGFGDRGGDDRRGGGFGDRGGDDRRGGGFGDRGGDERRGGGFGDRGGDERRGGGFGDRGGDERRGGGFGDRGGDERRGGGFGDRGGDERRGGGFGDRGGDDRRGSGFGDRRGDDRRGGDFARRDRDAPKADSGKWR